MRFRNIWLRQVKFRAENAKAAEVKALCSLPW
jgi:hypothetical protein